MALKRENTRRSQLTRPGKTSAARPKKRISRKGQNQRGRKAPVVRGAQNRLKGYSALLHKVGLHEEVSMKPQVFLASSDSWTDIIIRYLVGARERRKWKTELLLKTIAEINKPEYKNKIIQAYPRQQLQIIDSKGQPSERTKYED